MDPKKLNVQEFAVTKFDKEQILMLIFSILT